ncbi:MAG: AbrB/MazE/SpoVT family DNA-binding domain-containing protein [Desulfofustis sp. PB-SRB1]|nr:AbrB/MazE/SpoVT family DNA-binding domain-containing protein [Desulfofustis sp. PB-SRB1]
MQTAKLFINGRSQAVRLPKNLRFSGTDVFIGKIGKMVVLIPKDDRGHHSSIALINLPMILWIAEINLARILGKDSSAIHARYKHLYLYNQEKTSQCY